MGTFFNSMATLIVSVSLSLSIVSTSAVGQDTGSDSVSQTDVQRCERLLREFKRKMTDLESDLELADERKQRLILTRVLLNAEELTQFVGCLAAQRAK